MSAFMQGLERQPGTAISEIASPVRHSCDVRPRARRDCLKRRCSNCGSVGHMYARFTVGTVAGP